MKKRGKGGGGKVKNPEEVRRKISTKEPWR
jgi:hypothetical protein